ncbi:ABC transporter permease [Blastococcus sp. LR1]|uniref:ABC transporter permease n=1 Tax=Blastococcus sp. LR1 TaxID=2877000 RepID=UPI001CCEDBDC|nr:ABC transporter permease [Blastococcus sp. LR1]MCA0144424.1 ABC transporter permease [Blastococcus sp. LR1]
MSRGVPFGAVVVSEWTKLRSVRSTWVCTALYLLVVATGGWFGAAITQSAPRADIAVSSALTGFGFGQVLVVVLGVLAVTSEFRTGMVLTSLTAVPGRGRLLMAKTVVVVVWTVLLTALLALFCWFAATRLTAVEGGIQLTDPAVQRQLLLQVACATLTAVLAVGLGALVRSSAGALGAGLGVMLVLPPVLAIMGSDQSRDLARVLPVFRVGDEAFFSVATSWQHGLLVLGVWAAAAWVLGVVLLSRRDV